MTIQKYLQVFTKMAATAKHSNEETERNEYVQYFICYDGKELIVKNTLYYLYCGVPLFNTYEAAEKFMKDNYDDLVEYCTAFKED